MLRALLSSRADRRHPTGIPRRLTFRSSPHREVKVISRQSRSKRLGELVLEEHRSDPMGRAKLAKLSCRQRFDGLSTLDRKLKKIRSADWPTPQNNCPDAVVWREISGGVTSPGNTLANVEHASLCQHCGTLLREAVAEFINLKSEMTEAERQDIARLACAQSEWQERLARRLARRSRPPPKQPRD